APAAPARPPPGGTGPRDPARHGAGRDRGAADPAPARRARAAVPRAGPDPARRADDPARGAGVLRQPGLRRAVRPRPGGADRRTAGGPGRAGRPAGAARLAARRTGRVLATHAP